MRKLGLLLSLVIVLVLAMVSPAAAAASTHSGNGMNRQGGPGTHPGNGWKDPGQDQGSATNLADPDCSGNRSSAPQRTNIGACDTPTGTADKPGGNGGFDADRDWNNGCGNDTDFEDDNNGQCHGPHTVKTHPIVPPPATTAPCDTHKTPSAPPPKDTRPPKHTGNGSPTPTPTHDNGHGNGNPTLRPAITPPPTPPTSTTGPPVATVMRPATQPPPAEVPASVVPAPRPAPSVAAPLPFTGPRHSVDITALGMCLVAIGSALVRFERR